MFIVVWKRPNNTYYYRYVKGTYKKYFVGYYNQYNHEVVLIIEPTIRKVSIKKRFKCFLIRYIKKL